MIPSPAKLTWTSPETRTVWPALGAALLLRLPLFFLPGVGRDEALYWYWSHHPEPAYAPLMQLLVNLSGRLPLPPLQGLRITVLILGLAAIWLLARLLCHYAISLPRRRWLLLSLALSPWQTYTGAILHPDAFMLAMLLAFSICILNARLFPAAILAGLGIWVKPSGELLALIAVMLFLGGSVSTQRYRWAYAAVAMSIPFPVLFCFDWNMITAIAEFGRMEQTLSLAETLALQLTLLALLGGPALCLEAVLGAWRGFRQVATHGIYRITGAPLLLQLPMLTALAFLGAFCSAIALTGQVKGNWMLPAFVMLLPLAGGALSLRWLKALAIASGIISAVIAGCLQLPDATKAIETAYPNLGQTYAFQAGTREARVSAAASWSNRVSEYHTSAAFAEKTLDYWHSGGTAAYPNVIITDDYGLAAQIIFTWQQTDIRLQVVNDGIFSHQNTSIDLDMPGTKALILAVQQQPEEITGSARELLRVETLPHPYARQPVQLAMLQPQTP